MIFFTALGIALTCACRVSRSGGIRLSNKPFRSRQQFSIGFKSGEWAGNLSTTDMPTSFIAFRLPGDHKHFSLSCRIRACRLEVFPQLRRHKNPTHHSPKILADAFPCHQFSSSRDLTSKKTRNAQTPRNFHLHSQSFALTNLSRRLGRITPPTRINRAHAV